MTHVLAPWRAHPGWYALPVLALAAVAGASLTFVRYGDPMLLVFGVMVGGAIGLAWAGVTRRSVRPVVLALGTLGALAVPAFAGVSFLRFGDPMLLVFGAGGTLLCALLAFVAWKSQPLE